MKISMEAEKVGDIYVVSVHHDGGATRFRTDAATADAALDAAERWARESLPRLDERGMFRGRLGSTGNITIRGRQ